MTEVVLGFEVGELIIIYAVFFGAALAKGVTGLGFSTACLPFLVLALGLRETLPLLLLPSMASNLLVMRSVGHFRATVVGFWPLFLAQVPGVLLGLWLLTHLAANVAVAVLVKRVKQVTPLTVTQEMVVMDYHLLSLDLFHIMEVAVLETQHLLMQ
ncbi:MAG: hypothetical protein VXY90_08955 [Pseudomonadota bacterium]|nr:hypothetical protein [Pseudomonadota bacterium]